VIPKRVSAQRAEAKAKTSGLSSKNGRDLNERAGTIANGRRATESRARRTKG